MHSVLHSHTMPICIYMYFFFLSCLQHNDLFSKIEMQEWIMKKQLRIMITHYPIPICHNEYSPGSIESYRQCFFQGGGDKSFSHYHWTKENSPPENLLKFEKHIYVMKRILKSIVDKWGIVHSYNTNIHKKHIIYIKTHFRCICVLVVTIPNTIRSIHTRRHTDVTLTGSSALVLCVSTRSND